MGGDRDRVSILPMIPCPNDSGHWDERGVVIGRDRVSRAFAWWHADPDVHGQSKAKQSKAKMQS